MMKIRKTGKNDCRIRKNIAQIYVRSITLTIAVFLLTATIVLGPTSIQQQQQQHVLAQEPSEPG
ncbi:MAG: hypothetical protein ACRD47_12030, partial [Nitrososphaeraceae archaeon]